MERNSIRVDPYLRNLSNITEMVRAHGSTHIVFGDVKDVKIHCRHTPREASVRLYNYAAMLTYMRKTDFLDQDYKLIPGTGSTPHDIFQKHTRGGLHYYENTRAYMDAKKEFYTRFHEVERHLSVGSTRIGRKSIAIAMCVEDNIDYVVEDFQQFVDIGEGNPVYIARQKRKMVFLNANNYMVYLDEMLMNDHHITESAIMAENRVLWDTIGYPPMMRQCYINLSTSIR